MSEVEDKVVRMQFDGSRFNKACENTLGIIDKLRDKLNFRGVEDSFEGITSAAESVDMSNIEAGATSAQNSFDAMGIFCKRIVENIADKVVELGDKLVSFVTGPMRTFTNGMFIEPVTTGFNEYEEKIGAIQTILAATEAKGEDLESVTAYLEELNEYSDKTIYSFHDMTSSIGKFTNAGIDLDKAVIAMKGISNEAAISGANATEAARAMYNLSQAMSIGYMQRIDWKSIENANMATLEFKQNLVDAAFELGTLDAEAFAKYDNNVNAMFQDALADEKWLTNDVMLKVLTDYGDETTEIGERAFRAAQEVKTLSMLWDTMKEAAQSGWGNTYELIVGNKDQAVAMFTAINDAFDKLFGNIADARNALVGGIMESGEVRKKFTRMFSDLINAVGIVRDTIRRAFEQVFGVMNPEKIGDKIAKVFGKIAFNLERLSDKNNWMKIQNVFVTIFTILKPIVGLLKFVAGLIPKVVIFAVKLLKPLFNIAAIIGEKLPGAFDRLRDKVNEFISGDKVQDGINVVLGFVEGIKKGASILWSTIVNVFSTAWEKVRTWFDMHSPSKRTEGDGKNTILGYINGVIKMAKQLKDTLVTTFSNAWTAVKTSDNFSKIFNWFKKACLTIANIAVVVWKKAGPILKNLYDELGGIVGIVRLFIANKFANAFLNLSNGFTSIGDAIGDFMESITSKFHNEETDSIRKIILDIALIIAALAVATYLIAKVDLNDFQKRISIIVGILGGVGGGAGLLGLILQYLAFAKMDAKTITKMGNTFLKFAVLIAVLAFAAVKLIDGIATAMQKMVDSFNKIDPKDVIKKLGILYAIGKYLVVTVVSLAGVFGVLKKVGAYSSTFGLNVALFLVGIAGAVAIMVFALNMVKSNQLDSLNEKLNMLSGLFVVIGLLLVCAGRLSVGSALSLVALTGFMFVVVGIILVMGLIINSISKVPGGLDALNSAYDFLTGLLITVSLLLFVMTAMTSKFLKNAKGNASGVVALIVMVGGFIALITTVALLFAIVSAIKVNFASAITFVAGLVIILIAMVAALSKVDKIASNSKNISGTIKLLLSMAGVIAIISGLMFIVSLIPVYLIAKGLITIGLISLGMLAFMALTSLINSKLNKGEIESMGKAMISLSAALAIIAGILFLMDLLMPPTVWKTQLGNLIMIAAMLVIPMLAFGVAAKLANGATKSLLLIGIFLSVLFAEIVAGIILVGSMLTPDQMTSAVNALSQMVILVGVLGILFAVATLIMQGGGALTVGLFAALVVGSMAALIAMMLAIKSMGTPEEVNAYAMSMLKFAGAFAIIVGVLAAAAMLLGATSAISAVGILLIAGLFVSIGLACLELGAGVMFLSKGIDIITGALAKLASLGKPGVDVIIYFFDNMIEKLPIFAYQLGQSVVHFGKGILDATWDILKGWASTIWEALKKAFEWVKEKFTQSSIGQWFAKILDFGSDVMDAVGKGVSGGIETVKGAISKFANWGKGAVETVKKVGETIGNSFDIGVRDPVGAYCEGETGQIVVADTVAGIIGETKRSSGDVEDAGYYNMDNFIKGMTERSDNINYDTEVFNGDAFEKYLDGTDYQVDVGVNFSPVNSYEDLIPDITNAGGSMSGLTDIFNGDGGLGSGLGGLLGNLDINKGGGLGGLFGGLKDSLGGKLDIIASKLGGDTQIVLDSGQVVGATVDKTNTALGKTAAVNSRVSTRTAGTINKTTSVAFS